MPETRTTPRRSQRERTEATTGQLLKAARKLFARDGFARTSLEAVVAEAGVTKGALYHHFPGKASLFEAVFREEERRICEETIAAYRQKPDPLEGAYAGCRLWLEAVLEPGVQRIMLLDAPSVLGWQRMREIEAEYGLALIKANIRQLVDAGAIRCHDVDSLAHLLFGALSEGALFVAGATDQRAAKRKFERQVKDVLEGLRA